MPTVEAFNRISACPASARSSSTTAKLLTRREPATETDRCRRADMPFGEVTINVPSVQAGPTQFNMTSSRRRATNSATASI